MTKIMLTAELRETGSTPELKAIRKAGWVPANVYSRKSENRALMLPGNDVKRYRGHMVPGSSFDLQVGNETIMVIVKEVQRNPSLQNIIHVDFQELTAGEKIKVSIPIHLFNRDAVETGNMVVQQQIHEIEIETLPKDLVQSVDVDCKLLRDGASITVGDLPIFKNEAIEVLTDAETIVAALTMATRAEVTSEEGEEAEEAVSEDNE